MLVQKARNGALVAPGGFEADVNLLRTFLQASVGLFLEPVEEPAESIFGVRHSVGSGGFLLRSDQGDFKRGSSWTKRTGSNQLHSVTWLEVDAVDVSQRLGTGIGGRWGLLRNPEQELRGRHVSVRFCSGGGRSSSGL